MEKLKNLILLFFLYAHETHFYVILIMFSLFLIRTSIGFHNFYVSVSNGIIFTSQINTKKIQN